MSCKSALYGANTSAQELTNGVVSFGSVVRRFGQNINLSGGNLTVSGSGYYAIDANVNVTATGTDLTVALYKDGVVIPGASAVLTTVAASDYQISIPCIIRQVCNCESTITAVVSAGTVTSAAVSAEKI